MALRRPRLRTVPGRTDRVVVVGAGLAGLATALRLRGAGREVTVVERGDGPGGRAGRIERQGYTQVYNLDGGEFRWVNAGRPVFRQDRPTAEVHPYNPTWGLLLESQYRIKAPPLEKKSAAP